jgi:hypothetical protein
MVGRRDAYWASGGSAVTNSLLLSAGWVVGAVFADRNAPALGGILNQHGVGSKATNNLSDKQDQEHSLSWIKHEVLIHLNIAGGVRWTLRATCGCRENLEQDMTKG